MILDVRPPAMKAEILITIFGSKLGIRGELINKVFAEIDTIE